MLMKINLIRASALATAFCFLLLSCQKEEILQESSRALDLQGDFFTWDTSYDCGPSKYVTLADSLGNTTVDYCANGPCTTTTPWGSVLYVKQTDINGFPNLYLLTGFSLAPSYYTESSAIILSPPSSIQMNGNLPVVNSNWSTQAYAPLAASYGIVSPLITALYGSSCFEWALQVKVARLNIFGAPVPASRRTLYAYDNLGQGSPYVIDDCYESCGLPISTGTEGTCKGCRANVSVTFQGCHVVDITSCKPLRQIVIVYEDCSREYYDNLTANTASLTAAAGKVISHVYVRSGCRGNLAPPAMDFVDTNGNSYPNIYRFRFDTPCRNADCN
jgi:hypothetical protein